MQLATAATASAAVVDTLPSYRVVSAFPRSPHPGMPGPFPGKVVRVHAGKSIDTDSNVVDVPTVREMISRGMRSLAGASTDRDAWASFFNPKDVVGIKLNCSGAPDIRSSPEVVGAIVENLVALNIPANNIYLYERFPDQLSSVQYDRHVPAGVNISAIEMSRGSILGYDPKTFVEVDFFGEDDTRSNMIRLVTERFTKIINVPNMKDHQAAGVTGCLKNIAYGNFSNVARSHRSEKTNTLTFIGTLADVEPLRSRTVLQVMDGLRGVWHGGPFATNPKFQFFPKAIVVGTDPVAIDRLLIDVIEEKRKAEGALSVWDRSMDSVKSGHNDDPNVNHFIREPGHIEHAGKLGLGVYDKAKIRVTHIEV
ncbi:MAG: DUF362 domain-containing protein [Acidobacteriota bacterium]|nr:DUF362 domain-containing protein [Acidobacteriota bacterium]